MTGWTYNSKKKTKKYGFENALLENFHVRFTDSILAFSIFHVHRFRQNISVILAKSFFADPNA